MYFDCDGTRLAFTRPYRDVIAGFEAVHLDRDRQSAAVPSPAALDGLRSL